MGQIVTIRKKKCSVSSLKSRICQSTLDKPGILEPRGRRLIPLGLCVARQDLYWRNVFRSLSSLGSLLWILSEGNTCLQTGNYHGDRWLANAIQPQLKAHQRDAFPVVNPDLVVTLTLVHWKLLVMKNLFLLGFILGIFYTLQM